MHPEYDQILREIHAARDEAEDLQEENIHFQRWVCDLQHQVLFHQNQVLHHQNQVLFFQKQQHHWHSKAKEILQRLETEKVQHESCMSELHIMRTSLSWRITAPLRRLKDRFQPSSPANPAVEPTTPPPRESAPDTLPEAEEEASIKETFFQKQALLLDEFLSSTRTLDFRCDEPAKVAVVIALFNRAELTLGCLESLLCHTEVPLELILVDNASTDRTQDLLSRVQGAKVIQNTENRHFLQACNQAAHKAESDYILFLNNDTQIQPGAIEAALNVFEEEPDVGAVGGKILLLDGTLQEAGSIVWNDGSTVGVGRGTAADAYEHHFRREVDYCSGAFLLTPTKLFHSYHGFDPELSPAYYEEVDYCFRLRAGGHKTIYEPSACIVHVEFGSSEDTSSAIDLQIRNREIFLKKHREAISTQLKPDPSNLLLARSAPPRRPRVIYVDDRVPYPDLGSGFPRANLIVNLLVKNGFDVTLIPLRFISGDEIQQAHQVISPRVEVVAGCGPMQLLSFLSSRKGTYSTLWVSRPGNMMVVDQCIEKCPELKEEVEVVYDAEAVFALRDVAKAALSGVPMSDALLERKLASEYSLTRHADKLMFVSEQEAKLLCGDDTSKEHIILSHAVDAHPDEIPFSERSGILFVGNLQIDGSPNRDSLSWFMEKVWPQLTDRIPGLELHIIGALGEEGLNIQTEHVHIHGRLEDLSAWYRQCRVFMAPTRFAAGIPLKVIEAAGHGIPSVTLECLSTQLGWRHDQEVCVATAPPESVHLEYAAQLERLYTDESLWNNVRNGALKQVQKEHSLERMQHALLQAVEIPYPMRDPSV